MTTILELPPGARDGEFRAGSFNASDRTIELCWTTGATVRRFSWIDGPYDEELVVSPNAVRLERLNLGAPLLDTHSQWSLSDVLGSVVPSSARLANGEGLARVQLSAAPGDADRVQKIIDRIIRNVSVGYVRHQIEKTERDGAVPLWRVTDWEPTELTACAVGADPGAQFRAAGADKDVRRFPCKIIGGGIDAAAASRARMRMLARTIAA